MARQKDTVIWKLLEGSTEEWIWFLCGLAVVVVVLWAFARFVAWMRDDEDPAAAEQMMLTEIGELHRGGDLSEEEYRSIKGRLLQRLEDSADSKTPDQSDDESESASQERQDPESAESAE